VMYEVGDGALKLTVAQYLTPGDISIQGVGITPDIELLPVSIGAERIAMNGAGVRRERDPKRLLEAFGKVANDVPLARVPFLLSKVEPESSAEDEEEPPLRDEEKFERDDAIDLAARLLKDVRSAGRGRALSEADGGLRAWAADQDARIAEALGRREIDWTAGPARPGAAIHVAFGIDKPQPLAAGARAKLRLSARNDGPEPLYRVHAVTESDSLAMDDREFVFGRIGPGETVTREVPVTIPKDTWDRTDQVAFRVWHGDVEAARPEPSIVATRGSLRPRFAYSWQVQDAAGNGDGVLNPGEAASVVFDVQNVGEGAAGKVLVSLRNKSGDGVYIRNGRVTLRDGLPIGRTAQARFSLELKRGVESAGVTLEVGILDQSVREFLSEEFTIPVVRQPAERFEPRHSALRTLRSGVRILVAATPDAPALFETPEGFFLRSSARRGDWYKVDIEEERFAFVRASDVEAMSGVVRFSPLPEAPLPRGVEPAVEMKVSDPGGAGDSVWVSGQVRFAGHAGEARRKVLIFRGNDKVYFWTRKGPTLDTVVPVDARIPLLKGRNDIAVYAIEGKDRSALRRFTLWSATGRGSAEGALPGPSAGGAR